MSSLKQAASLSQLQSNAFAFACHTENLVDKLSQLHIIAQGYLDDKCAQSTAGEIHMVEFRFEAQEMCGKNWNGLFKGKTLPNQ